MAQLPLSSLRVSAENPDDIELQAGYVDPDFGESISENSCSIETSDWKSGIYVIHANIGKESVNKKFIINK